MPLLTHTVPLLVISCIRPTLGLKRLKFLWEMQMCYGIAGGLEFQCDSEVLSGLESLDLEYVTANHLYAAQTAVSQCLSDKW